MNGISTTFVANFESFYAAVNKATVQLKELEVDADKVQRAVDRVGNAFSGQRITQDAMVTARAIEQIGGAALLTDKEARRVNATMVEAIDKARRMGQQVPPEFIKLATETERAANAGKGLGGIMGSFSGIAKAGAAAFTGMFAADKVMQFASQIVNLGGELTDMAARTGLSTTAIQQFKYAGSQVGVGLEDITKSVNQLQRRLAGDDKSVTAALKSFGVDIFSFKALKPEEQFAVIAEKVGSIENPMLKTKAATDLFGKAGAELLPVLTDEFSAMTEKANSLGIVMDEQTVAAMDTLGDTVTDLMSVGMALIGKVLSPLVPVISVVADVSLKLANVLGQVLGYALDKIGQGLKWLANQFLTFAAATLGTLKSVAESIPGFDKLTGASDKLGTAIQSVQGWQQKLNTEQVTTSKATRAVAVEMDTATGSTRTHADAVSKLVEELSGAGAIKQVQELEAAFKRLTPEQQQNARIVEEVMARYEKLRDVAGADAAPLLENVFSDRLVTQVEALKNAMISVGPPLAAVRMEFDKFGLIASKDLVLPAPDVERSMVGWNHNFAKAADAIGNNFKGMLQTSLPQAIMSAIQGGGNILSAAGSTIGSFLTGEKGFGKAIEGGLTKLLGKGFGAAVNAIVPGLGALMGPALSMIGSGLSKLFGGVSPEVKAARAEVDKFQQSLAANLTATQRAEAAGRGWAQTTIAVRDAYLAAGRTAADADAAVRRLWDTNHPEQAKAAMQEINAVMADVKKAAEALDTSLNGALKEAVDLGIRLPEELSTSIERLVDMGRITGDNASLFAQLSGQTGTNFKAMEDAAKKFGVELSALGPAFQQNKLNTQASEIIDAFKSMRDGGADVIGVITGMSDEINTFIKDTLQAGGKVPENMRPILEAMLEQGRLTDENGNRLEDLSRINFGAPIETAMDRVIKKLQELIDKISGGLGFDRATQAARDFAATATEAIESIPDVNVGVPSGFYSQSDYESGQGYATGTMGRHGSWFRNFGSGTVTMLHGTEAVVRRDQAAAFAAANGAGNAEMVDELRGLRSELLALPQHMARAVRDAVLVAG